MKAFLKSQINPHFIFNSLNTIYGFAIREEARHTAGGIQKLGDMMRFMLEENTKDRIPLDQEVEYLKNYISLQKMRIDTASDITVEACLDPACQQQQIAPMLLIPFVENAFKHGVSLDHPEKGKKGIGNQNVIDRLDLIYPSKHSLRFSPSETEYQVSLTVHLK
jgi:two-component system LytT family sensor kinase